MHYSCLQSAEEKMFLYSVSLSSQQAAPKDSSFDFKDIICFYSSEVNTIWQPASKSCLRWLSVFHL